MNKNSFFYWYPFVGDLDIPQPRTSLVPFPPKDVHKYLNPDADVYFGESVEMVRQAVLRLGCGYPVFVRTDLSSAKHEWDKACFVTAEQNIKRNLFEIMCFNHMADMMGLAFTGFVVREYIEMASKYKAFAGMPVNPERRYFIDRGNILCHHHYWIDEAISGCCYHKSALPDNWRELSAEMNHQSDDEISLLSGYTEKVAARLGGFWSVDYCKAKDGTWYLIDMATGGDSWHPEDCEIIKGDSK